MQDEQFIRLCQEIYREHKDVILAIIKYGALSDHPEAQAADKHESNGDWVDRSNRL